MRGYPAGGGSRQFIHGLQDLLPDRVTDRVSLDEQLAASRRSEWPGIGTMCVDQQPCRLTKVGWLVDAAVHVNKLIASRIARAANGAASGWAI